MDQGAALGVAAPVSQSLERRLQEFLDKEEIRQVMYSYARGTDRCDADMIRAAYHDDAIDDHGSFRGDRETVVATITSNDSGALNSMHHIGNVLIELDGDRANVESYFLACQVRETDGMTYTRLRAGRYVDRFERRDGRWRIARRMVVDDWSRLDEVVEKAAEVGADSKFGSRTGADPSYLVSDFRRAAGQVG
jgi:ketosteroid isomerase-like protein